MDVTEGTHWMQPSPAGPKITLLPSTPMSSQPVHSSKHYILFSVSPPSTDALRLRKHLSDALDQAFGTTSAAVNIDVLWIAEDGKELVVRVHPE